MPRYNARQVGHDLFPSNNQVLLINTWGIINSAAKIKVPLEMENILLESIVSWWDLAFKR